MKGAKVDVVHHYVILVLVLEVVPLVMTVVQVLVKVIVTMGVM